MNDTPTPRSEPERIGDFLPAVLRQLAREADDELTAMRLRSLAARWENPTDDDEDEDEEAVAA